MHTISGQIIDGPANGLAPTPWDVMVQPKQMFHDHHRDMEVPHTACVQKCHDCHGTGKIRCKKCSGNGKVIATDAIYSVCMTLLSCMYSTHKSKELV